LGAKGGLGGDGGRGDGGNGDGGGGGSGGEGGLGGGSGGIGGGGGGKTQVKGIVQSVQSTFALSRQYRHSSGQLEQGAAQPRPLQQVQEYSLQVEQLASASAGHETMM
jgi:hypothetical protein